VVQTTPNYRLLGKSVDCSILQSNQSESDNITRRSCSHVIHMMSCPPGYQVHSCNRWYYWKNGCNAGHRNCTIVHKYLNNARRLTTCQPVAFDIKRLANNLQKSTSKQDDSNTNPVDSDLCWKISWLLFNSGRQKQQKLVRWGIMH